jgi:antitoxin component YwqK of YwqJK toxin-antitoxin module
MKRLGLLMMLGLVVGVFGCGNDIKVWTERYPDSDQVKEEYQYYNDPETNKRTKDGWYNLYYPDGKYQSVGHYDDDHRNGRWTEFDEDESVIYDGDYREGEPWTGTFLTTGSFLGDTSYRRETFMDGVMTGDFSTYFETGELRSRGKYVDGEVDGDFFWFFKEGGVSEKIHSKRGKEVGEHTVYYPSGRVKDISTYRDGVLSGPVVGFSSDGDTLAIGQFEDDRQVGTWTRFREDKPAVRFFTSTFTDEEGVSKDTVYSIDGLSPVLAGTRRWKKLDGVWSSYGEDGGVLDEDEWKDGWCVSRCESDQLEDQLRDFVW